MKDKSKLYINVLCNGTKPVVENVEKVKSEEVKTEKKNRKSKKEK